MSLHQIYQLKDTHLTIQDIEMFGYKSNTMGANWYQPGNNQLAGIAAGGAASTGKFTTFGGGGTVGGVGVGVPVYNSGGFTAGVGAFSNYGKGVPSNPGVGVGMSWKF